MKILNIVIALLFALFAVFQHNDPDGMVWAVIYGSIAVLAILAVLGKGHPDVTLGALILVGGLSLMHVPGTIEFFTNDDGIGFSQGMSFEYGYIEEMRECFGLALGAAGLFGVWKLNLKNAV